MHTRRRTEERDAWTGQRTCTSRQPLETHGRRGGRRQHQAPCIYLCLGVNVAKDVASLLCMCRDTPLLRATPSAVAPIATDACKSATTRWMPTYGRKERGEAYHYPGTRAAGQRTASLLTRRAVVATCAIKQAEQPSPQAPSSKLNRGQVHTRKKCTKPLLSF
jgi:hypothetical protein